MQFTLSCWSLFTNPTLYFGIFFNVDDLAPLNHILVQNLGPYFDSNVSIDDLVKSFDEDVVTGGPWRATLVRETALQIENASLPCVTLEYMLKAVSAGASEKAHGELDKSVN